MKLFYSFLFVIIAFASVAQAPQFRIDGVIKNRTSGKPEAGVKVEIVQSGSTVQQISTATNGRYDLKGTVDLKKPFTVIYSKSGFVSKTLSFDYSKMNVEDAPPGDIRPIAGAETDMIPSDPKVDLSFLNTEPVGKFYWDEGKLEPAFDKVHADRIKQKVDKVIAESAKNNVADEAKYNALISEADILYNQQKWEEARTKYEAALAIKPMEKHPNQRILELDALILAKKKEELANQQSTGEYDNLIKAADALRDQKKYEMAILKYEEALRIKKEDYPESQIEELEKIVENDKKYKEAVSQADMFYTQRSYQAARDKYALANKLKPTEPHPIARLAEIDKKANELNAAAEKKKKYEEALAAADLLYDEQKYEEAKLKYQEALGYEPSATFPEERIKECDKFIAAALAEKLKKEKIAKLLEEGNTFFVAAKLVESKQKYSEVLTLDPANEIATARLAEIATKEKEALDAAAQLAKFNKLVADGDVAVKTTKFADAQQKYEEALLIKADPVVEAKLEDVKKKIKDLADKEEAEKRFQSLKTEGFQLAAEEKWLDAKSKLKEALEIKADLPVTQKLTEVEARIKANEALLKVDQEYQELITAAQAKEAANDLDGAIAKYKDAALKKPAETLPKTKIAELEELKKTNAAQAALNLKYNEALKKGKDLMAAQKYLDAIKEFNIANGLKPEEKEPIDLAAECERLEKEKGNDENEKIEKILTVALAKFEEKDLVKSKELAERYLTFRPKEPRAEDLIRRIAEYEATEKNYAAKMVEAEKLVSEKSYDRAIKSFEQAKSIKPTETKPQERIDEVNKLIAEMASASERDALYKDFMTKGALSEKAKSWDQALINYQNALNVKNGDRPAQDKVNEIQQIIDDLANASKNEAEKLDKFNKLIQEADDLFSKEDYLAAKTKYESALAIIPDNSYANQQVIECDKREKARSLDEEEKGYRKVVDKADENFNLKDYDKAKEYYTRATNMRPTDPYPPMKLKEIENLQNPPVVGEVKLEPLGVPYSENSIMDGYAALVQADIERKNLKDQKVENVISNATQKESELGESADLKQKSTTNEIYAITSSLEQYTADSDLNRQAIVQALKVADEESQLVAHEEVQYKQADLLKSQEKLNEVVSESEIDYSTRDGVYADNTDLLHAYAGALRIDLEERNYTDNDKNLAADQNLSKIDVNMEGISIDNTEKQKKNDQIVESVVIANEKGEEFKNTNKKDELLVNNNTLEKENIKVSERQENDAKNAPENRDKIEIVGYVVSEAEQIRKQAAQQRTTDNTSAMGGITIQLEDDHTNRDLNRKENVELVKQNEVSLLEGKRQEFEKENLKYLKNKNTIESEEIKKKDVVDKDDQQVAKNISGVENLDLKSREITGERAMSDDEQRQKARSGIETINANSEEFTSTTTKKQDGNTLKLEDLNKTIGSSTTNQESNKKNDLLSAQQKLEKIETTKPEKARIKNALGEEYPEGVSQESFTQNDENGLMKAIITRRIVVINGEGNVYVRTQTLDSVTYSKNDRPITEQHWNKETTGPHLQKHY